MPPQGLQEGPQIAPKSVFGMLCKGALQGALHRDKDTGRRHRAPQKRSEALQNASSETEVTHFFALPAPKNRWRVNSTQQ